MDKAFLEECLAEGMSLEAIGDSVGKHESTVSYWLKKHGLSAAKAEKHAAKGDHLARSVLRTTPAPGIGLELILPHPVANRRQTAVQPLSDLPQRQTGGK